MEEWRQEILERANQFAAENCRSLIGQLGYGYDGSVFATDRWPIVDNVMAHFARMGIYLADVKPGNVTFA